MTYGYYTLLFMETLVDFFQFITITLFICITIVCLLELFKPEKGMIYDEYIETYLYKHNLLCNGTLYPSYQKLHYELRKLDYPDNFKFTGIKVYDDVVVITYTYMNKKGYRRYRRPQAYDHFENF